MLNPRERVEAALNHREGDRVPLDFGATNCSGIHVSSLYALRQALASTNWRKRPVGIPPRSAGPHRSQYWSPTPTYAPE